MNKPSLTHFTRTLSRYWFPYETEERYAVSSWVFVRVLALIYFSVFLSLSSQVAGLLGNDGILPAQEVLSAAEKKYSAFAFFRFPTLFWYGAIDFFLIGVCWIGLLSSVFLFLGFYSAGFLVTLYICFLSFTSVGANFFSFLGDHLLLETGFLSLFFISFRSWLPLQKTPNPPKMIRYLVWWLIFRVHFQSVIHELTAGGNLLNSLSFTRLFYQNQPLPSQYAWYFYHLPTFFHWLYAITCLIVRTIFPFFIFGPQHLRWITAAILAVTQLIPLLTGNYGVFSLLVMALCLFLLDDSFWKKLFPFATDLIDRLGGNKYRGFSQITHGFVFAIVLFITTASLYLPFLGSLTRVFRGKEFLSLFSTFGLSSQYAFQIDQQKLRPELMIEGSVDGTNWKPYEFKWKPESPKQLSSFLFTYHPRLDWQMADAARTLNSPPEWVHRFCKQLLHGSKPVLQLLANNPFPDMMPTTIRINYYKHHFTDFFTEDRESMTRSLHKNDTLYLECKTMTRQQKLLK